MALTILMVFSVKVVLSSISQPAKTVCSKKFWFSRFLRSNFGSFNKRDDPMSQYEPRYVLYLAGMSRYEDETLSFKVKVEGKARPGIGRS